MSRVIRYFATEDESYIGEIALPEINLKDLQVLFSLPEFELMYEVFEISASQASFFQNYISIDFDFQKYDYFLDYDT